MNEAYPTDAVPLPPQIASKIVDREQLLARVALAKAQGARVVQCHGCFDIVHPGHIRHLRQAKSLGTLLLVSITGDASIAKGTGRPLIPEELRAENLASLDCVDLVFVESDRTATELLESVKPNVYVKGKEYETNNDPRFLAERKAVERHGGRVVFSSGDVVFSSTSLIAAMGSSIDPYHHRLLQLLRHNELQGPRLYNTISRFKGKRVVVIGETILDTYILCDRPEVAGESPVLALRPIEARHYDGGAAVVARHLAAMGASPILVTPLPRSDEADALVNRLQLEGIEVRPFTLGRTIPEKQRFLSGAQKLMKLDLLEPYVVDASDQHAFIALARETCAAAHTHATIVTDFGLGLFSSTMLLNMCPELRNVSDVLAADVSGKRSHLKSLRRFDLLCPSESEARDAMGLQSEGLPLVTWRLLEETSSRSAMITMGHEGLISFDRLPNDSNANDEWRPRLAGEHIPAFCPIALDPLGCGDALLAAATLGLCTGAASISAAFLGAAAAATHVQRLGNTPVSACDLRQAIARVHASHLTYSPSPLSPPAPSTSNHAQAALLAS